MCRRICAASHLLRQGPSGKPERATISWSNMALLVDCKLPVRSKEGPFAGPACPLEGGVTKAAALANGDCRGG
jgi:hypothetical protein